MNLETFNGLDQSIKKEELIKCCGSIAWVNKMLSEFPFHDTIDFLIRAEENWTSLSKNDWLEAFEHHPKIGDLNSLKEKYASSKDWAKGEQSDVNSADEKVLNKLAEGNLAYEEKFGYIFIVCATGKTAEEMLIILEKRLNNEAENEIKNAMMEQNKITQIRLKKLLA